MTPEQRTAIYAAAVAAGPLLAFYGIVAASVWPLWLAFIGAFLAAVTAFWNRPTKIPEYG